MKLQKRLQGGWSATEMVIASSLVATVMISAGTFFSMYSKRVAIVAAKSAATEQANRMADILERYASRSTSYWAGNTSWNGESDVVLFCVDTPGISPGSIVAEKTIQSDPNGNTDISTSGRYLFYWSDATGTMGNSSNEMPMLAQITSWSTSSYTPMQQDFVTQDGRSLFPCVTSFTHSNNFSTGVVTITVTAVARQSTGGTERAANAGQRETITVTRVVNRPR